MYKKQGKGRENVSSPGLSFVFVTMSKNGHCPSGKKTWAMNRCPNGQSIDPPCSPLFHDEACSQSDKPLQHCWNLWTLCKPKLHGVENISKMITLRTQHAWISSGKWIDKLPVLCSLTEHPGCTVSCECLRGGTVMENCKGELWWGTFDFDDGSLPSHYWPMVGSKLIFIEG